LPLPSVVLPDSEDGRDGLRRLLHGQAVPATHPGLPPAVAAGTVAVVATQPRALLLAAWEGSGDAAVLRPTRVVVAPP
jgi:hypothetical protein